MKNICERLLLQSGTSLRNELVKICSKSIQIWTTLEICANLTRKKQEQRQIELFWCLGCRLVGGNKKSGLYFQMNYVVVKRRKKFLWRKFFVVFAVIHKPKHYNELFFLQKEFQCSINFSIWTLAFFKLFKFKKLALP